MPGTKWDRQIQRIVSGVMAPVADATISVRNASDNTLATIYDNKALSGSPKANPFQADSNGRSVFYAAAGVYNITAVKDALTVTYSNEQLGNAQERDTGTSSGNVLLRSGVATVAISGDYDDLSNKPTLGTVSALDTGTAGGQVRTNTQNDSRFAQRNNNLSDLENAGAARSNLGLGNAAQATLTTSNTDTTAGRAADASHVVNLGSNQTIGGTKTFSNQIVGSAGAAVTGSITATDRIGAGGANPSLGSFNSIFAGQTDSASARILRATKSATSPSTDVYAIDIDCSAQTANLAASGVLRLLSGDSGSMVMLGNGNVHIGGTTDPGVKLGVTGAIRSTLGANFATSSGNVGIGTSSPTTRLHINGDNVANRGQLVLQGPSNNFTQISFYKGNTVSTDAVFQLFGDHTTNEVVLQASQSTGSISFRTGGTNLRMRILSNGNVHIGGTTDPGVKLGVTGAISATTTIKPGSYTVATVPSASTSGAGALIYVSDETGGAVPAFSDGTNWRRVTDRTVISA
jgi:hypothetical protein